MKQLSTQFKAIFTLMLLLIILNWQAKAQNNFCSTSEKNAKAILLNPNVSQSETDLNFFIQDFIKTLNSSAAGRQGKLVIPIVFHILHDFGSENISNAQVLDQLRIINEDFNKMNADTIEVIPEFKPIIANVGIEFRLPRFDPNGNATNGIIRHAIKQTFNITSPIKKTMFLLKFNTKAPSSATIYL